MLDHSVAVITARGGSKRIPRKNIRAFFGKPIISYSIEAALESGLFDEVMVSTDDAEIADVARSYGAKVPFMRSSATSDDFAGTADVLLEVIEEYMKRGRKYHVVCCIYPTAPFVTPAKLREAADMLYRDAKTVLPVVRFSYPPQRGLVTVGSYMHYWQPEYEFMRSQDLPPIYHDAGQFYFRDVEDLLNSRSLLGSSATGLEVPEAEVQDIDNESDWELAEMKYERMVARHGQDAR